MNRSVSIAFQTDKPLSVYGPLAETVERYGFHTITVYNDLYYQPAWLPLMEIARSTERVQLGPTAVNPFTSHPINIAGNIALIDEASNGRAYLGLARGGWLETLGILPSRPVSGLREAMECILLLLKRSVRSYEGESFSLQGGETLRWNILRSDVPILLGSWGKKTIEICFELVSEIKIGGTASPEIANHYRELIDSLSEKSNAQNHRVKLVVGAVCVVDEDETAARERARVEAGMYIPVVANLDPRSKIELDLINRIKSATSSANHSQIRSLVSDGMLKEYSFAGTARQVVEQVEELFEVGVDRVEFGTPHGLNTERGLSILGEEVYPALGKYFS